MVVAIVGAKFLHGASLLTKRSLAARSVEFVFSPAGSSREQREQETCAVCEGWASELMKCEKGGW